VTAISGKGTSSDLRQVVAYMLDTAAMAATIVSLLHTEMAHFAKEMSEIETRFPGFKRS